MLLEVGHAHETSTAKCYARAEKTVNNPEITEICAVNHFLNRVPAELERRRPRRSAQKSGRGSKSCPSVLSYKGAESLTAAGADCAGPTLGKLLEEGAFGGTP